MSTNQTITLPSPSWFTNSFTDDNSVPPGEIYKGIELGLIVVSAFILVHSFYLHGRKATTVRVCNDIACLGLIGQCACLLVCVNDGCSVKTNAVVSDLLGNGIFAVVVQAMDNYITYARYVVIIGEANISFLSKCLIFAYVCIFLYFTWFPFFTFLPFFINVNDERHFHIFNVLQRYVSLPSYVFFDFFFSCLLYVEVRKLAPQLATVRSSSNNSTSNELKGLIYRALLHNLFSIGGVIAFAIAYPPGSLIQDIICVLAIHLVFNWKAPTVLLAQYLWDETPSSSSSSPSGSGPHYHQRSATEQSSNTATPDATQSNIHMHINQHENVHDVEAVVIAGEMPSFPSASGAESCVSTSAIRLDIVASSSFSTSYIQPLAEGPPTPIVAGSTSAPFTASQLSQ